MNIKTSVIALLLVAVIVTVYYTAKKANKSLYPGKELLMKKENFDTIINGKKVELFTLQNKGGITVQLTNYGGYLVSIITPDKDRKYADVLLGYNRIDSYLTDRMLQGCIVGPYAHLIAKGKFSIDGIAYQLDVKNGGNNVHSRPDGFYKEVFDAEQEGNRVTMIARVPDMKSGFPGNRIVTAIYELLPNDTLKLSLSMTTDKKTICNMTNHAYFNLAGEGTTDVLNHLIQIFADSITPYYQGYIPTGEIVTVENTPFDFGKPLPIGKRINADNDLIRYGKGYDHNFVLSKKPGETGIAVRLSEPVSKRFLEIYTNQPGIQFYTGNYMDGTVIGKSGKPYNYRYGVALEPQKYPDSPNHPNFPSPILEPGKVYCHIIKYAFGVEK
jgi:aldose 1-epimerase